MKIKKNGSIYRVKENERSWTLSLEIGALVSTYNVSKEDCPTFESLEKFVAENSAFNGGVKW